MSESYPDLNTTSQTYGDKAAVAKDAVITSKVSTLMKLNAWSGTCVASSQGGSFHKMTQSA